MYDSTLGRWVEEDPAGNFDGMNPYEWEVDDPESQLDPSGLSTVDGGTTVFVSLGVSANPFASGMMTYASPKGQQSQPTKKYKFCPVDPCPQNHDMLTCMANCIEQNDPFNLLAKGILTGIGGPIPKALANAVGVRTVGVGGDPSLWTTPPSIIANQLRLPANNVLRTVGKGGFYLQMIYAYYMLGVEDHCLGACLGYRCSY